MKYDHVAPKARIALTVALGIFSLYPLGHLQAQTATTATTALPAIEEFPSLALGISGGTNRHKTFSTRLSRECLCCYARTMAATSMQINR